MGRLDIRIVEARNIPDTEFLSKPDPYCVVRIEGQAYRTSVCDDTCNPAWNEVFSFQVKDVYSSQLRLELWNENVGEDEFLGAVNVSINGLMQGVVKDSWYRLEQCQTNADLRIRLLALDFGISVPEGTYKVVPMGGVPFAGAGGPNPAMGMRPIPPPPQRFPMPHGFINTPIGSGAKKLKKSAGEKHPAGVGVAPGFPPQGAPPQAPYYPPGPPAPSQMYGTGGYPNSGQPTGPPGYPPGMQPPPPTPSPSMGGGGFPGNPQPSQGYGFPGSGGSNGFMPGGMSPSNQGMRLEYPQHSGLYRLIPRGAPGKVLGCAGGGSVNGAALVLWDRQNNAPNQEWWVMQPSPGVFQFAPRHATDKRIDGNGTAKQCHLWDALNPQNPNQQWRFEPVLDGSGFLFIRRAQDGHVLDVANYRTDNGATLHCWAELTSAPNQQWGFERIG
jgi:hypothetical protein